MEIFTSAIITLTVVLLLFTLLPKATIIKLKDFVDTEWDDWRRRRKNDAEKPTDIQVVSAIGIIVKMFSHFVELLQPYMLIDMSIIENRIQIIGKAFLVSWPKTNLALGKDERAIVLRIINTWLTTPPGVPCLVLKDLYEIDGFIRLHFEIVQNQAALAAFIKSFRSEGSSRAYDTPIADDLDGGADV